MDKSATIQFIICKHRFGKLLVVCYRTDLTLKLMFCQRILVCLDDHFIIAFTIFVQLKLLDAIFM